VYVPEMVILWMNIDRIHFLNPLLKIAMDWVANILNSDPMGELQLFWLTEKIMWIVVAIELWKLHNADFWNFYHWKVHCHYYVVNYNHLRDLHDYLMEKQAGDLTNH
jgi:hypothetical protein